MSETIGIIAAEHIAAGLVADHQLVSPISVFPEKDNQAEYLVDLPYAQIVERITDQIVSLVQNQKTVTVGIGIPGIVRNGIIEDSPNLQQTKGQNFSQSLTEQLNQRGISARVHVFNDTDVMAAGIAATRHQLDKLIRVWWLGNGVGFGRYPQTEGIWEGGHIVVSLDPKERFCACGGTGHLEGIMGHRAMRLRFLDLEPEEIFAEAEAGDERCAEFVKLWHRALAAATASSIHVDGPGRFYVAGPNAHFVQIPLLGDYLYAMVKMSPLQGSLIEVVSTSNEVAIIGAAVNAIRAASLG